MLQRFEKDVLRHMSDSMNSVGALVLIIGVLKQIIVDSVTGRYFAEVLLRSHISGCASGLSLDLGVHFRFGDRCNDNGGRYCTAFTFFLLALIELCWNWSLLSAARFSPLATMWASRCLREYCGTTVRQAIRHIA